MLTVDAGFNHWLRDTIQENFAIDTIATSKLLTVASEQRKVRKEVRMELQDNSTSSWYHATITRQSLQLRMKNEPFTGPIITRVLTQ